MNRADELLRRLCDDEAGMALSNYEDTATCETYFKTLAECRAYLNEKPHEHDAAAHKALPDPKGRDASPPHAEPEKPMNAYGPVTTADRLERLLEQQGEAVSRFMREAAKDAVYHLRVQHRRLLESDASPLAQPIAREAPPDDSELASDVAYLRAKNDPRLFDIANQLIYCWAQDGLLSKTQAECDKLQDALAETKRPLDDQMRRLNERVIELNDESLRLRRIAAHVPGLVYITAKEQAGYGVAVLPTDAALKSAGKE